LILKSAIDVPLAEWHVSRIIFSMVKWLSLVVLMSVVSCSSAKVRSTVDSYGESQADRSGTYFFDLKDLALLEKQASNDCKLAAKDAGLKVSESACPGCQSVVLHMRLTGTEQILRSGPGYGSAWGIFGGSGGAGIGLNSGGSLQSSREAGREITLNFYSDVSRKNGIREIQIRSVGKENSVPAVAYEMCKAAFQDYPADLKGQFYEIDYRKP
jgi:hypothetical protein